MEKKKNKVKKNIILELIIYIIFVVVISSIFYVSYYIYTNNKKITYYNKKSTDYSYITISEMSDTFAKIKDKELHFVRDETNIYIIAIKKKDINKYQKIIDYTYGISKIKKSIKIYGYPVKINEEIKAIVIKDINKFLPYESRIDINNKNFATYLPNTYLDTSITELKGFNYIVFILLLIVVLPLIFIIIHNMNKNLKNSILTDE